jgi:hypothetical protein
MAAPLSCLPTRRLTAANSSRCDLCRRAAERAIGRGLNKGGTSFQGAREARIQYVNLLAVSANQAPSKTRIKKTKMPTVQSTRPANATSIAISSLVGTKYPPVHLRAIPTSAEISAPTMMVVHATKATRVHSSIDQCLTRRNPRGSTSNDVSTVLYKSNERNYALLGPPKAARERQIAASSGPMTCVARGAEGSRLLPTGEAR